MSEQAPSIFGSDYKGRKNLPLYFFLTRYFPKALVEVMKVCIAGNVQHNPELDPTDINWSRGKSTDQLNTAQRHLFDHALSSKFDEEPEAVKKIIGGNTRHLAKAAWRILAQLELDIEEAGKTEASHGLHQLAGAQLVAHHWASQWAAESEMGEAGITPSPYTDRGITKTCMCGQQEFFGLRAGDLPPTVIIDGATHSPNGCVR
jgi:hypothetical protein